MAITEKNSTGWGREGKMKWNKIVMAGTGCIVLLFSAVAGHAAQIPAVSASGAGSYTNSPGLIIDNIIPAEGSGWTSSTNVYWHGTDPIFTVNLGGVYTVEDVLIQVDNNDSYQVRYSLDNVNWTGLFTISSGYGEVGWGMDTMSTQSGHPEYISQLDFVPVLARYLQVQATGGDNAYALSEVQAFGSPVPIPGAFYLLGTGCAALAGLRRRR